MGEGAAKGHLPHEELCLAHCTDIQELSKWTWYFGPSSPSNFLSSLETEIRLYPHPFTQHSKWICGMRPRVQNPGWDKILLPR